MLATVGVGVKISSDMSNQTSKTIDRLDEHNKKPEHTFLLRRPRRHDDDIALPGLLVLGGPHARRRVAVVGRVAEVLDLGVADFGLGVHEQDRAGDLVVLCVWVVLAGRQARRDTTAATAATAAAASDEYLQSLREGSITSRGDVDR